MNDKIILIGVLAVSITFALVSLRKLWKERADLAEEKVYRIIKVGVCSSERVLFHSGTESKDEARGATVWSVGHLFTLCQRKISRHVHRDEVRQKQAGT